MKKYMIVYEGSGGDFFLPGALFADGEEEIDKFAEQLNNISVKYEVYIYTIYGYKLLYRKEVIR